MYPEPRFDDPSRTADYGHFPWENRPAPIITEDDVLDFLHKGRLINGQSEEETLGHLTTDLFSNLHPRQLRRLLVHMLHDKYLSSDLDAHIEQYIDERNGD